jgi:DNA-directed RNA polymerase specialized sigma24 family protein
MPGRSREDQTRRPEFYLRPAVKGQQIHPHVYAAFEQLWPWFWSYVGQQLGDPDRAPDLAEEIAYRVSKYVETRSQIRSFVGLCRVASVNFITSTQRRENQIRYRGLGHHIEAELAPAAADDREDVELSIWTDQILKGHTEETRISLQLLLLDHSWPEIGRVLGLSADQARLRFRRAMEETDKNVLPGRSKRGRS